MLTTMSLPPLPKTFKEVLYELSSPDMFAVSMSENDERTIFQQIVEHPIKYGYPCSNFLEWRDAAYDAMVDLGYELS